MRRLAAGVAISCEMAATPRCRCRCGGLLHGAGRASTVDELVELPAGDPHHPDTEAERRPPRPRPAPAGKRWRQLSLDTALDPDAEVRELTAELLR